MPNTSSGVYLEMLAHFVILRTLVRFTLVHVLNLVAVCAESLLPGANDWFAANDRALEQK